MRDCPGGACSTPSGNPSERFRLRMLSDRDAPSLSSEAGSRLHPRDTARRPAQLYELDGGDPDADLTKHVLMAARPGITITAIGCQKGCRSPATREVFADFGLVLVRRGGFERQVRGDVHYVDASTAFFARPEVVQEIRHPRGEGDESTLITLSEAALVALADGTDVPDGPIAATSAIGLLHARLIARLKQGLDTFELEERLCVLVGQIIEQRSTGGLTRNRPATEEAHRRLTDRVRESIAADPSELNLGRLAADVGYSPFHVSRVFRWVTGSTLTQHRNRLRVAVALHRLADGERNLANLAADLGFADQSHLTRVLRVAVGEPPSRIREILTSHVQEAKPSEALVPRVGGTWPAS